MTTRPLSGTMSVVSYGHYCRDDDRGTAWTASASTRGCQLRRLPPSLPGGRADLLRRAVRRPRPRRDALRPVRQAVRGRAALQGRLLPRRVPARQGVRPRPVLPRRGDVRGRDGWHRREGLLPGRSGRGPRELLPDRSTDVRDARLPRMLPRLRAQVLRRELLPYRLPVLRERRRLPGGPYMLPQPEGEDGNGLLRYRRALHSRRPHLESLLRELS